MLVLGIETSTKHASVALATHQEIVGAYELGVGKTQDQVIVPATEMLLADAGLSWDRLAGVAVGLGPGMFTGLRVGVASGKALAQALRIPIVGLSSLDVVAHNVRHTRRLICACVDARRKEVFWAFYRAVPGGVQRLSEVRCAAPEHCTNEIEARGEATLVVGSGPHLYPEVFDDVAGDVEAAGVSDSTPGAVPLVELALPMLLREESHRLVDLKPLYIRKTDAEINWERAR